MCTSGRVAPFCQLQKLRPRGKPDVNRGPPDLQADTPPLRSTAAEPGLLLTHLSAHEAAPSPAQRTLRSPRVSFPAVGDPDPPFLSEPRLLTLSLQV